MPMQIPLIAYISIFSSLLPIIALLLFRKIKEWHLWVILFYCLYSFVNDEVILYRASHKLSYPSLLFTFTIVEFISFSVFLYSVLKNPLSKKILSVVSILFLGLCLYPLVFRLKGTSNFDSVQTSVEAIIVIVFALVYLFEEMNQPQVTF